MNGRCGRTTALYLNPARRVFHAIDTAGAQKGEILASPKDLHPSALQA
jgi:hypothetical protein